MTESEEATITTPEEVAQGDNAATENGALDDLPLPILESNCTNLNLLGQQNNHLIQNSAPQFSLFSSNHGQIGTNVEQINGSEAIGTQAQPFSVDQFQLFQMMMQQQLNAGTMQNIPVPHHTVAMDSNIPKVQIQFPTESFDVTLGPTNNFVPIVESVSQGVESESEKDNPSNEHSDKEEGSDEDDEEASSSNMDSLDLLKATPLVHTIAEFEKKYPIDLSQDPEDRTQFIEPNDSDVLFGRGGMTNHHPGNKVYRALVEAHKPDYNIAPTKMRPRVAKRIIFAMRNSQQNTRFLKRESKTNAWYDVGDAVASSKCAQALREKSPEERKQSKKEKELKKAASTGVLYQNQVAVDLVQMPSLMHAPDQMYFNNNLQFLPTSHSIERHSRKRGPDSLESPEPSKILKMLESKESEGDEDENKEKTVWAV
ncbi:hypothetical protein CTEN210_09360 [Chaetoceros tenuissimus]|uniref:DUF6824 domain-containing protein n=1 Tax=Chaetoceros tenuissimus TaxID=426638 RepID=A0AAD3CVY9_9STRA|nr:hypothetical protein CTEN210_09360 [Chaetoceros tenuissimus]